VQLKQVHTAQLLYIRTYFWQKS